MARIIQQQSDLRKEYKKYHNRTVIFKVFTGLCFVLWMLNIFVWHTFDPVFLVPTFFGAAGFELLSRYNENKADTLKAGIDGEEKTLRILDEDRRKNAELFEEAFYGKKNLNPQMVDAGSEKMITVPDGVDAETLAKVLANPEMVALLSSLAKTVQVF